jgi:hypothetical protein
MIRVKRAVYFALGIFAVALALVMTSEPYRLAVAIAHDPVVVEKTGDVRFHLLARGTVSYQEGESSVVRLWVFGEKKTGILTTSVTKANGRYVVTKAELDGALLK